MEARPARKDHGIPAPYEYLPLSMVYATKVRVSARAIYATNTCKLAAAQ